MDPNQFRDPSSRFDDIHAVEFVEESECADCHYLLFPGNDGYLADRDRVVLCERCGEPKAAEVARKLALQVKEVPLTEIPKISCDDEEETEEQYRPVGCYCAAIGRRCGVCSRLAKGAER